MGTGSYCCCDRRMDAQMRGDLVFLPHAGAWVFTTDDVPIRSMSPRARYMAFSERAEYPHVDHTGEPVKFYLCVWCGRELPGTMLDVVRELDGLGDPNA